MNAAKRSMRIVNRETGEVATELDLTGWSPRNFAQMWDGMVRQVNFELWMPVYVPPMGDDETAEEWLAR